jgi:cell wall-associated NlpC family hydrolase
VKGLVLSICAALLSGPVLGVAVLAGSTAGSDPALVAMCQSSGPVTGLDATQAHNARTIVAAAQQATISARQNLAAQTRAELITLMTAATESSLHNYANPTVLASELLPNDGPPPRGGDHDSVGLFQQRASWGALTERMDPVTATELFVTRLLAVPAWQTLPPGVAAQLVQISNFPDRYATMQTSAQTWLHRIAGSAATITCGDDGLTSSAGPIKPGSIPAGYAIPDSATDAERRAVTFALAQLGKPYVYGAAGPESYDCSGLTMAAWTTAGVDLPHYTVAQYQAGVPVADPSLLAPGDLIFIPGDDGSLVPPNPQHVGMYIGDGYVIEAPQTGDVVKIVGLSSFRPVIGIRHVG